MKQLFKTSLGFSVVLSSLPTTVTAQTREEVVVTAQKCQQAFNFVGLSGLANQLYSPPQVIGASLSYLFGN